MFADISFLIISIVTLVFGAERFVDASSKIAKNFGISDLFVGLTIVALGTSAWCAFLDSARPSVFSGAWQGFGAYELALDH